MQAEPRQECPQRFEISCRTQDELLLVVLKANNEGYAA